MAIENENGIEVSFSGEQINNEINTDIVFMYGEESPVNTIITEMYMEASEEEMTSDSEEDNIFGVIAIECSKRPELSDENLETDTSEITDPACKNIEEALELVSESAVLGIEDFRRVINIIYTSNHENLITYLEDIKNNFGENENVFTVILSKIYPNQVTDIEKYLDEKTIYLPIRTKNLVLNEELLKVKNIKNALNFYGIMGTHDGLCLDDDSGMGTILNDLMYNKIDMFETFNIRHSCIMQNVFDAYYTQQQAFVNFAKDIVLVNDVAMDDFEGSMARFLSTAGAESFEAKRLNRKSDFDYINVLNLHKDSVMVAPYNSEINKCNQMIKAVNSLIKEKDLKHVALFGCSQIGNAIDLVEENTTNRFEVIFAEVSNANPDVKFYAIDHLKLDTPIEFITQKSGFDLVLIGSNHLFSYDDNGKPRTTSYYDIAQGHQYPYILDLNSGIFDTFHPYDSDTESEADDSTNTVDTTDGE